jgi:hypothetical protein
MGRSDHYSLERVKGGDMSEYWKLSPQDTLVVIFRKNIVTSFRHVYSPATSPTSTALRSTDPDQRATQAALVERISLGQQNADGTWSARSGRPALALKVMIGQAQDEVFRIMGRPDGPRPSQSVLDKVKEGDLIAVWTISPEDTMVVTFREDVVNSLWHEPPVGSAPKGGTPTRSTLTTTEPTKADTVVEKVANVASGIYLAAVCPGIYRKPALFMTAADMQSLQVCNANGFMLFGMYLYTGGQH